jgi:hypothetical protein
VVYAAVLVVILTTLTIGRGDPPETDGPPLVQSGQVVVAENQGRQPKWLKPINSPERVRQVLEQGKTYHMLTKGGFVAPLEPAEAGAPKRWLAYVFETLVHRTIEKNDGFRVVEVRHFENMGMVKLLVDAEEISLDLGPVREQILGPRGLLVEDEAPVSLSAKSVGDAILSAVDRPAAESPGARAFGCANSLSGKTVRITYADGIGVESVEPIGCTLIRPDVRLLFRTPVLADCYILPRPESLPGRKWKVDARQFTGLVELGQRVVPSGRMCLQKEPGDGSSDPGRVALRMEDESAWDLFRLDGCRGRVGDHSVKGTMVYRLDGDFMKRVDLRCPIYPLYISQDWFLFDDVFLGEPVMTVSHDCWIDERMTRPLLESS